MNQQNLRNILEQLGNGRASVEQTLEKLKAWPFETTEDARIDHHRALRCGMPEVIFCPGKTIDQIVEIFQRLAATGQDVLATRATAEAAEAVLRTNPAAIYEAKARCIVLKQQEKKTHTGFVAVVTAGTGDIPVAEEARVTAELMGQQTRTIYDAGVAGIHRLLAHTEDLQKAAVVIVVAGMEGALASVVGGLVAVPVIAVPTSIGYGASLGGIAPLLTMLNSCAPGICVVNIDNGFAAGTLAARINRK